MAVVQYTFNTQTIHRTTQNKQYVEQHKYFGRVRVVYVFCLCAGLSNPSQEPLHAFLSTDAFFFLNRLVLNVRSKFLALS
jgi:hypothetical protein